MDNSKSFQFCNWFYRPGKNKSHWAMLCNKDFNYLSRINNCDPYVGVADYYNNSKCPVCGKPVKIDYFIIEKEEKKETFKFRKCSDLKPGESVVFYITDELTNEKVPIDGNVILVDHEQRKVDCCYLQGYRTEYERVDYKDMIAVGNPDGVFRRYGNISGYGDCLIAE